MTSECTRCSVEAYSEGVISKKERAESGRRRALMPKESVIVAAIWEMMRKARGAATSVGAMSMACRKC